MLAVLFMAWSGCQCVYLAGSTVQTLPGFLTSSPVLPHGFLGFWTRWVGKDFVIQKRTFALLSWRISHQKRIPLHFRTLNVSTHLWSACACECVCVCGWWRSAASINIHSIIFFSFLCSGPLKHLLWLWGALRFIFELLLLTNRMVMRCCTCWSAAGAGSPCSSRGWSPAGPWPETWGPRWTGESPADCSRSPQTATAPGLYTGKPNQHVNPQEPKGNP